MAAATSLEDVLPSIQDFLQVVDQRFPVLQAYLLGSYATGRAGPDSDVDLVVISEAFSSQRFEDNVALGVLTWGIDTRIEPVALRPEALQADTPLMSAVRRQGLLVYQREGDDAAEALPQRGEQGF